MRRLDSSRQGCYRLVGPYFREDESASARPHFLTVWPHGPRSDSAWMLESPRTAIGQTRRDLAVKRSWPGAVTIRRFEHVANHSVLQPLIAEQEGIGVRF